MTEQSTTTNGSESSNSIELSRGQKGTYGWTLKLRWPMGEPSEGTLMELRAIDAQLRREYPTAGE